MSVLNAEAQALAFLREAYGLASLDLLQDRFAGVVANWGVTRFSVTQVMEANSAAPEPKLLFGQRFAEWDARYVEAGYFAHDPCVPRVIRGHGAFTWAEVRALSQHEKVERMFAETSELELVDGMVVPIYGGDGELLCARLMSEEAITDPAARGLLEGLATVYATMGLRLLGEADDEDTGDLLTKRERQCLYWASQEKSDDAIGIILGISGNTAHTYIQRAKSKLGTSTRGAAANKARAQGVFVGMSTAAVTR